MSTKSRRRTLCGPGPALTNESQLHIDCAMIGDNCYLYNYYQNFVSQLIIKSQLSCQRQIATLGLIFLKIIISEYTC